MKRCLIKRLKPVDSKCKTKQAKILGEMVGSDKRGRT